MIRNIHDAIIATNVMSDKVAQSVEAHGVGDNIIGDNIKGVNIAAANSTGNIHQNLVMKFFILVYDLFCFIY